uniref:BZIP domain-containing protein n=1 Tax=Mesocestoides corti TaxID=53468 RepID=A0A5K3EWZ3_MESCO
MEVLELSDVFPGLDDEDLSSLDLEQVWATDVFDNILENDFKDDLLTDITSKNAAKPEPVDADIFDFANELVVGDEVEVNNSTDHFVAPSGVHGKPDLFNDQDAFHRSNASDTSPETFRLSPEISSNCSTPPITDSFGTNPNLALISKKFKRHPYAESLVGEPVAKKTSCSFSPPAISCDTNSSTVNRIHYVLQKGQTLILQTEKPYRIPQVFSSQARLKTITSVGSTAQQVYRADSSERTRGKALTNNQRTLSVYPLTPPGSHTSSDTDAGADSPADGADPRNRLSIFSSRNGYSTPSASAVRVQSTNSTLYATTSRPSATYLSRPIGASHNADFTDDYANAYSTVSSSTSYRQQPIFQSSSGVLVLTEEEKRTLIAEGYSVPTRLPLSKQEERNLKKIRRKIKNKISAQESRRKKKEYVETLEKRVEVYSQENSELKRRLDGLEGTNRSLLSQLRHLQQLVNKANLTSSVPTTSSTSSSVSAVKRSSNSNSNSFSSSTSSACLMVFLVCFAALFAGQPDAESNSGSSLSFRVHTTTSGHIVGDLSTLGSLHQIGYTWSGKNHKTYPSNPRPDGDYARGPNVSHMRSPPTGTASIYRVHEWARTSYLKGNIQPKPQNSNTPAVPTGRSRLLGSSKEFEECEPLTWWEYFFGKSGFECPDTDGTRSTEETLFKPTGQQTNQSVNQSSTPLNASMQLEKPLYLIRMSSIILQSA